MDGVRSSNFQPLRLKPESRGIASSEKDESEQHDEKEDTFYESITAGEDLDSEEEQQEGARHETELLEKYPLWDDPDTNELLDQIYGELEGFMKRQGLVYELLALDTEVPFASSCPNGAIYFSRSMLEALNHEELLFFAAHELAHTELRHYASRQRRLSDLRQSISAPIGSSTRHRFDAAAVLTVRHQEEFEADFQAGIWIDQEVGAQALTTLHKLCQELSPDSLNRPTHPPFQVRVKNLREKLPFPPPLSYLYCLLD